MHSSPDGSPGCRSDGLSPGIPSLTHLWLSLAGILHSWHLQLPGFVIASLTSSPQLLLLGIAWKVHDLVAHCLASRAFLWKPDRNIHDPVNLAFCLSVYQTSITEVVSRCAASPESGQPPSGHSYRLLCVPNWLTAGSTSVYVPEVVQKRELFP